LNIKSKRMNYSEKGKIVKERRYDIDWLRVVAMLAIFFFHCARFFGAGDWHLKNADFTRVPRFF